MSILSHLFHRTGQPREDALPACLAWLRDPLAHPAIAAMTEREIADLPFRLTACRTPFENCR